MVQTGTVRGKEAEMKKLESSFRNMVFSLGCVTIVAALLLAWVNDITREPIRAAELQMQNKALEEVLPVHDNDPVAEKFTDEKSGIDIYPAREHGKLVGAAVMASADGFADKITVICGFGQDGTVYNYAVTKQAETPGLGTKMQEWFRSPEGKRSVVGRHAGKENLRVAKDGGDVDAITAATISSRAFLQALNEAFTAYQQFYEQEKGKENE